MKAEDFELFSTLVKQRSGLVLAVEKAYLLESRLLPVARKYNMKSLEDMAQALRVKRDEVLMFDITDAMTTNETSFFRDRKVFAFLQNTLLPNLLAARQTARHIRLWSAATSTGQEAYSLAMICAEEADRLQGWKIEILGTDISRESISRAKASTYSQYEVQRGLPAAYLVKYFQQIAGDKWQIKDNIRQMAQFREGNLLTDLGLNGIFDVILCRNVLTHFDEPTKTRIMNAIGGAMQPDGYLLLGSAETIPDGAGGFKPIPGAPGLYRPASALPLAKTGSSL